MSRTRARTIAGFAVLALCPARITATTWHVDEAVFGSGDGLSWNSAFKTIQEGIDAGADGDTVIVRAGLYESINLAGKNIILRSADPTDRDVVATTIIDGGQAGSVVTFAGTESETCVLSGFTIRNGLAEIGGGILGGGLFGHTRASIQNNVVTGNSSQTGGGAVAYCDGTIQNNIITGNSVTGEYANGGGLYRCSGSILDNTIFGNTTNGYGGGLSYCQGRIQHNLIKDNIAVWGGGGLSDCLGVVEHNIISGNGVSERSGGGLSECHGLVQYNIIKDNWAEWHGGGLYACDGNIQNSLIIGNIADELGGGLAYCDGTIQNNTVARNLAGAEGGGFSRCEATIRNCIVWDNGAKGTNDEIHEGDIPRYSCIQGWVNGGRGNIDADPLFVDASARDYHLESSSACIDAGACYYWPIWPQRDCDGNCRLVGGSVDMGCYEHGASLDTDGDLLSDSDELGFGSDPEVEDTDGDGLRDGLEIIRGSNPLKLTPASVIHVPSDVSALRGALLLAVDGDEIVVAPGTYHENLHFPGLDLVVRGSDPENPEITASTIIDGEREGPVMSLTGEESESFVISGLTITGGRSPWDGGGICGGSHSQYSRATIRRNLITDNWAHNCGGGVSRCDGLIEDNRILGNSASSGGGIGVCGGTIQNNTISGNWANAGGGLYWCHGEIKNNAIADNSADDDGGGLCQCDGTVQNNIVSGNTAHHGGAMYRCVGTVWGNIITGNSAGEGGGLHTCVTIQNNILAGNSAVGSGGGLRLCSDTIQNNTIFGNSALRGGGLSGCGSAIHNCIIWGNIAAEEDQIHDSGIPAYCCVQDWTRGGEGNLSEDPRFFGTNHGDFRLLPGSPCIDAGNNDSAGLLETDIGGRHRIMFGGRSPTVDIGAYEFHVWAPRIHSLTGDLTLSWSSLAGKTYSVYCSSDMLTWQPLTDDVSSRGDTVTLWADPTCPLLSSTVDRRYYRILENE